MSRLNWYLSRQAEALPVLTLLAWLSMLTVIALLFWLFLLTSQTPQMQPKQAVDTTETTTVIVTTASPDKALLAGAPKIVQVTTAIQQLYKVADQHRLNLEEVVYQDQQTKGEPLLQYAIDFTVKQSYPELKAFMTELLAALPYLALEQVSFEREDINTNELLSRFRFKLFLESEHE